MRKNPEDSPSGEDSVSRSDVTQTREEILEYWTPQRMAEAKPREIVFPEPGRLRPDHPGQAQDDPAHRSDQD